MSHHGGRARIIVLVVALTAAIMPAGPGVPTAAAAINLTSPFRADPPRVDGSIDIGEWPAGSARTSLPNNHGHITVANDATRLYVLVDVLADKTNQPAWTPGDGNDYFWMTFDRNRNGVINTSGANQDLNYAFSPDTFPMRMQKYVGSGSWTGLSGPILSSWAPGFGCFFGDGSLSISIFPFNVQCNVHRVYEFAFDLSEITNNNTAARMGVRVNSGPTAAFQDNVPANFHTTAGFDDLIRIALGSPPSPIPTPAAGSTVVPDTKPLELTQAIQDRDNTLPLVADKDTAARVYPKASTGTQPAVAYLYGRRGGVELPGSPLATFVSARSSPNRANLDHTANFLLPKSWTTAGTTSFQVRVRDYRSPKTDTTATAFSKSFSTRRRPVIWVIPINTGTNASPTLASDTEIQSQESYLRSIYPVPNITFVRKPWTAIGTSSSNLDTVIQKLNNYYDNVVIAWFFTLLFTGKPPFDLPDQIYGFMPSGGGTSDPVWWNSGRGVVAAGGCCGTSREGTFAHEVNHNLDRKSDATWGAHIGGCGTDDSDEDWPYGDPPGFNDRTIQEVGFDTRRPWQDTATSDTISPASKFDLMTYCNSDVRPTKWISPYRWQKLFARLAPGGGVSAFDGASVAQLAADSHEVLYVSGRLNPNGTGSLNPVTIAPGMPSEEVRGGRYSIQVLNADGKPELFYAFDAQFENPEGEPLRFVPFNFQLPHPGAASKVQLVRMNDDESETVLDEIDVSTAAPQVQVTNPRAGQTVRRGTMKVEWTASDADTPGADLRFSLLYSSDRGQNWYPIASNVSGRSRNVDTNLLPEGDAAMIRVIATDGFNTAEDDSGVFTLAGTQASAAITGPRLRTRFSEGEVITFTGHGSDAAGNPVASDRLFWSRRGKTFAQGPEAQATLPVGAHDITLTARAEDGSIGTDRITVYVESARFRCGRARATHIGTGKSDRLIGTPGNDVFVSFGGNDRIFGRSGNDVICAGRGNDLVDGGIGNDIVDGGPGQDTAAFSERRGVVVDLANGTANGQGRDRLFGIEHVRGSSRPDRIYGNGKPNRLAGMGAGDRIAGRGGRDRLSGGGGPDRLAGGAGNDACNGGGGNDHAVLCEFVTNVP